MCVDDIVDGVLMRELEHCLHSISKIPNLPDCDFAGVDDVAAVIQRSIELCDAQLETGVTYVRTVHHLSCVGGTLIAKCIASMPNVLLLNEVDFHSKLPTRHAKPFFTPTDFISLIRQADMCVADELISKLFIANVTMLRDEAEGLGRHLVLRDHSHSHFLHGELDRKKPTFREVLLDELLLLSVVTVRDPADSFVSLHSNGWHTHFSPSDMDEYCRRYLFFLDQYDGVPIIRYEDFVEKPEKVMRELCEALQLRYNPEFQNVFSGIELSGDSGRSGEIISQRGRREGSQVIREQAADLESYRLLCDRLGYSQA